jgi:hypothetical protein
VRQSRGRRALSSRRSNDDARRRGSTGPENLAGAGWLEGGAESKDSTGIQASPNGMPHQEICVPMRPANGGPRAVAAFGPELTAGIRSDARAAKAASQLAREQRLSGTAARSTRPGCACDRGARLRIENFAIASAAKKRRGASLERITNSRPLRPALGGLARFCHEVASRDRGKHLAGRSAGSQERICTDIIADHARRSTVILKKREFI